MKRIIIAALLMALLASVCFAHTDTPEEFFDGIAPAAKAILPGYGLWPSVFLAQCAQESGFGRSFLAVEANNFFGRKCGYDPCVEIETNEVRSGITVRETHAFQKYGSVEEAIHDYARGYLRSWDSGVKVYKFMNASTPFTFIVSVAPTYASDPKYAKAVIRLIGEYNLERFDQKEERSRSNDDY